MKVIISPFSRKTPSGAKSPKDYPFWRDVIRGLKKEGITLIQIGTKGETILNCDQFIIDANHSQLLDTLKSADTFVSIDNFLPHFAHYHGKTGVVIFAKSDPEIFGYKENTNLLKDRKFLRPGNEQFMFWDNVTYDTDAFVSPEEVIEAVLAKKNCNYS